MTGWHTVHRVHTAAVPLAALALAALASMPEPARAQAPIGEGTIRYRVEQEERPALLGTAGLVGVNALLGGVSVGLIRELRGGSFLEGFRGGLVAGGMVYLGKTVAVQHFSGAGLLGRQIGAVGGSVASNVAAGAAPLSRFELPFGPVRLVLDRAARDVGVRVDPLGVGALAYALADPKFSFDARATLSAGTPVFRASEPEIVGPLGGASAAGLELYSVILLADLSHFDAHTRAEIFAHERVHTLQADAFQAFWGRALLEWLAPDTKGWQRAAGLLDINLGEATAHLLDGLLRQGVWEIEADHIGR